jgi:hypothetical protein
MRQSHCAYTTNHKTASFLVLTSVNWHSRRASRVAAHVCGTVLKKHLHVHPYKMITVNEFDVKRVEYFR